MFQFYPSAEEIDTWVEGMWAEAAGHALTASLTDPMPYHAQPLPRHLPGQYVKFATGVLGDFYGYWQTAPSSPAPLLVHLPGYGAEMSMHPELVAQGYHVLHVNPLGYATPQGFSTVPEHKVEGDEWAVLPNTLRGRTPGYRQWLLQALLAADWAMKRPDVLPERVSFFGTSQGGGAALLLGSLYQGKGVRCVAADVPFLTDQALAAQIDPETWVAKLMRALETPAEGWRLLGYVDTVSHAHRLTFPVLLTAGTKDTSCRPETINSLFQKLSGTRLLCVLDEQAHDYTYPFTALAAAWFRLYA